MHLVEIDNLLNHATYICELLCIYDDGCYRKSMYTGNNIYDMVTVVLERMFLVLNGDNIPHRMGHLISALLQNI